MMSIALLLRRSLRPLTLSGVIESTVSTKQTITMSTSNTQLPTELTFKSHSEIPPLNLYKPCLPNLKQSLASRYDTHILTLTSIQLEFWSPFHGQELHVFVSVVQKVLLLHLPHTFPEPGGTQISHQMTAFYRITLQSSTGWVTTWPCQPHRLRVSS